MSTSKTKDVNTGRRRALTALAGIGSLALTAGAGAEDAAQGDAAELRFPGDATKNKLVYQLNKADPEYQGHILNSVGAVLRAYPDNVKIAVVAFGPGIHILLKKPLRSVPKDIRDKVQSLHDYGVEFQACGNTLSTLKLTRADTLAFAKYVDVGAAALMELQQKGYAYISW